MNIQLNVKKWNVAAFILTSTLSATSALALPSLQLGGDGSSDWIYNTVTETSVASGTNTFTLNAYANAKKTDGGVFSGGGKYAWSDDDTDDDRYAYLVAAAAPKSSNTNAFDITVTGTGTGVSFVTSGYGTPPLEDGVAGHGIYKTYFEIYEFQFDGAIGDIGNVQDGTTNEGKGYTEALGINIISVIPDTAGVHFDLFTVGGDGRYEPPTETGTDLKNNDLKNLVENFAPWSHDAGWNCCTTVPEPGVLALVGLGLAGFGFRKLKKTS